LPSGELEKGRVVVRGEEKPYIVVTEYYAASDIFVFPTAYEAFSLVTLEAVASGLPILATKVNGTEELIIESYNGFFIKRGSKRYSRKNIYTCR